MANTILPGYASPIGNKWMVVFDRTGPSSYSNIATNSGTGDVVNATDLGFGGIDVIVGTVESSGTYDVEPYYTNTTGGAQSSVALKWYVTTTGSEAANGTSLSAKTVRLLAICV